MLPCLDELLSGWTQLEANNNNITDKIPLWIAASMQIYAEITLGLHSFGNILYHFLGYKHQLKLFGDNNPPRSLSLLAHRDDTRCLIQGYEEMWELEFKSLNTPLSEQRVSAFVFAHMECVPPLCGMQALWLEQQYKASMSQSFNFYHSLVPVAHLYVSMLQMKLVDPWDEMDYVLKQLSSNMIKCNHIAWHRWPCLEDLPSQQVIRYSLSCRAP
ncbi:hypothetical protein F5B22DRAFT_569942 [Xylaria bambusicola]|uniref:uncharacterized protein n=1 Tax=Xylaria bambusicola TaxID=326684 RepID=UPI002007F59B|nr:uncharacterized protein F5B22DRAFT_569942 [Xylaria bambusicola]KAI0521339.1 hypothetical protein F5B22DRAFT_569942 [Xylaria bambusicola]